MNNDNMITIELLKKNGAMFNEDSGIYVFDIENGGLVEIEHFDSSIDVDCAGNERFISDCWMFSICGSAGTYENNDCKNMTIDGFIAALRLCGIDNLADKFII